MLLTRVYAALPARNDNYNLQYTKIVYGDSFYTIYRIRMLAWLDVGLLRFLWCNGVYSIIEQFANIVLIPVGVFEKRGRLLFLLDS